MTEFSHEQLNSVYPAEIERHYWNIARNRVIFRQLKKRGLTDKVMLEIGCGTGVVLNYLRAHNITCYGVDLADSTNTAQADARTFYKTNFEDLPTEIKNQIEVVLLFDVIEHIPDEQSFLLQIKKNFPNATEIVFTVPARQELWSNYDTYYGHYRRYSIESVKSMLDKSVLKPIEITYFFHSLYLPAQLLRLFKRDRNTELSAPTGLMRLTHHFIGQAFYLEARLVPAKVPGTSIICSAKLHV